jgi:hypothetical protein
LDEEGVCKAAFELIFAFDEAISLGNKENVTVAQVKQYCEMESHEEKLHKLVMQSKINDTNEVMRRKATEIEKNKVCPTYPPPHTHAHSTHVCNICFCWNSCRLREGRLTIENLVL